MDIEVKDTPGQLMLVLNPISKFNGNLISIIHHHENRTPNGAIVIHIIFEIEPNDLDAVIDAFKKNGIKINKIGEDRFLEKSAIILIGHIIHTNLHDTIEMIDKTGYAEVTNLSLTMPTIDGTSSAILEIEGLNKNTMQSAISLLSKVAKSKNLLLIEPIENI
jgi:ACT domain-containing protein